MSLTKVYGLVRSPHFVLKEKELTVGTVALTTLRRLRRGGLLAMPLDIKFQVGNLRLDRLRGRTGSNRQNFGPVQVQVVVFCNEIVKGIAFLVFFLPARLHVKG